VAAIAFGRPANVIDGNVERVMARLFAVETPLPGGKVELKRLAGTLVTADRPGDWAQALMDLGATVCRPRSPLCLVCPVARHCVALATGEPERFPVKGKKIARPHRTGVAWVMRDSQGRVAVVRRPDKGLLGGMIGLPTSDWSEAPTITDPVVADWRDAGAIEHVFTHFSLTLQVRVATTAAKDVIWLEEAEALSALPTVFAKALVRAGGER
jgi:A/G-specific adenine glycosylase